jgi:hypothetical protein
MLLPLVEELEVEEGEAMDLPQRQQTEATAATKKYSIA